MIEVTVKGIRDLHRALEVENKEEKKALNTAIKVEGYQRLKELREQIRAGKPGGSPYADELSKIAGRTKRGALRKNQMPLYRLAQLVRYNAEYVDGDIKFSFAFIRNNNPKLTTSWKQLILKHDAGADVLYSKSRTELGRRLARIGGRLKKKGDPDAKYFFLRKTTGRRIDLPKRQIVPAYWRSVRGDVRKNVIDKFRRKMLGERI